nr:unnamed protein product [Digitaria exilis]
MGSRVAAALLRRGKDQASALLTPRLPRSAPAPALPRVGSTSSCGSGGGGGGGCLLPPRPGPAGAFSSASRFASFHVFRSFAPKTLFGQCARKMSTSAAALNSTVANGAANSGLKLLVTKGPQAQKAVGIWLFGCAAWVFSLVILGGITRLTRSGLSMTDWKFTGEIPPMSDDAWQLEFEKYKQSPEYKRLSALFALGGAQGLIGWWMVKSGLEEPTSEYVQPRVSPYRLATHLTSAFAIYCGYIGHIYTLDVCSYLIGLSASSWSIDSIVTNVTSYSHIEKAITNSS